jgi:hypothetical protein
MLGPPCGRVAAKKEVLRCLAEFCAGGECLADYEAIVATIPHTKFWESKKRLVPISSTKSLRQSTRNRAYRNQDALLQVLPAPSQKPLHHVRMSRGFHVLF